MMREKARGGFLRKEYPQIDVMKLFCAFLVLLVHTEPFQGVSDWLDYATAQILARIAVPLFFIAGGFFFAAGQSIKEPIAWEKIRHLLRRIGILYACWTIFYVPFLVSGYEQAGVSFLGGLGLFLRDYLFGFYHLWFFIAVLQAAVGIFFLRKVMSFYGVWVTALILHILGICLGTYSGIVMDWYYNALLRNGIFFGMFYFLMGMYIRYEGVRFSLCRCFLIAVFAMAALFVEGWYAHFRLHVVKTEWYFTLIPVCFFVFTALLKLPDPLLQWLLPWAKKIRVASTLIYGVHPWFGFLFVVGPVGRFLQQQGIVFTGSSLFLAAGMLSLLFSWLVGKLEPSWKFLKFLH